MSAPAVGVRSSAAGYHVDGSLALKVAAPLTEDGRRPSPSRAVDTVGPRAVIVARALLEVLAGWRPASQLARWTSHSLQQDLERRAPRRPTGTPLQLVRVKVSEQSTSIVEVCALAEDTARKRVRVIALRLELREREWIVTRLQAG